ncbi:MAG: HAD family hydrolase [Gammaproteobacteria bacterium TMED112]|nr:MAG: HAD family hydrolase [Gammaproteobacteria bacterium TMED112]|tara:strand:- start:721 stop:1368 length:648 start_codon:yes stop_codon:yes gene_type:complete
MQPKNSAVLFDLDGTLINSGLSFLKIVNELKEEESQDPVSFQIVREFSSRGASLVLKNAFPDASDEKIDTLKFKFLKRYTQIMTSDIHVYEGVEELLNFLTEKNISWGIVTNKSAKYTLPIIEKLKWHNQTNAIICPENVHQTKPDPEGILRALNLLDASVETSVYVGDHERDIQSAKNANVKSVACTYGYYQSDPLSWGADFIVDSPIEIKKLL